MSLDQQIALPAAGTIISAHRIIVSAYYDPSPLSSRLARLPSSFAWIRYY
jgi:hypothetical protein